MIIHVNDILFKISCNFRSALGRAIRLGSYYKSRKTEEILGCSFEFLMGYLESKFEPWMDWSNYGKYNGELNYGWDSDHIVPLSSARTEEELLKLLHHTNLQPLCSKVNRDIKKAKLIW